MSYLGCLLSCLFVFHSGIFVFFLLFSKSESCPCCGWWLLPQGRAINLLTSRGGCCNTLSYCMAHTGLRLTPNCFQMRQSWCWLILDWNICIPNFKCHSQHSQWLDKKQIDLVYFQCLVNYHWWLKKTFQQASAVHINTDDLYLQQGSCFWEVPSVLAAVNVIYCILTYTTADCVLVAVSAMGDRAQSPVSTNTSHVM